MSAFVVTLVAAEGLLPTMLQRVLFEDTSCCAGELTLHASESLLTGMCSHVGLEAAICCAGVFALVAAERLFSSMTTDMDFQISHTTRCVSTLLQPWAFCFPPF